MGSQRPTPQGSPLLGESAAEYLGILGEPSVRGGPLPSDRDHLTQTRGGYRVRVSESVPALFHALVDDAGALDPTGAGLHEVTAAHEAMRAEWWGALTGRLRVSDTELPLLRGNGSALDVVLSSGAGQIAGPAALCRRLGLDLGRITLALRDLNDLAGNVRRVVAAVDAARSEGALDEDATVALEIPFDATPHGWLSAVDEIAAAELQVALRLGGQHPAEFPDAGTVAGWIDACLDRETPFTCTRGLSRAVRTHDADLGVIRHGFLNVLVATGAAWDGAGADTVAALLTQNSGADLAAHVPETPVSTRRWFTSFAVADPRSVVRELTDLGLSGAV